VKVALKKVDYHSANNVLHREQNKNELHHSRWHTEYEGSRGISPWRLYQKPSSHSRQGGSQPSSEQAGKQPEQPVSDQYGRIVPQQADVCSTYGSSYHARHRPTNRTCQDYADLKEMNSNSHQERKAQDGKQDCQSTRYAGESDQARRRFHSNTNLASRNTIDF